MEADYNQKIYNFIYQQIKDTKYLPSLSKDKSSYTYPSMFKEMAEDHYAFPVFDIEEWNFAFDWCTANVYGDGCECETI